MMHSRPDRLLAHRGPHVSRVGSASRSPRSARRAFTLLELLIVIALIGMLAGLILAAVFPAMGTARETAVVAEISALEKACLDFKVKFGVEPPSFIRLFEDPADWDPGMNQALRRNRALVQKLWPDFNFSMPHDINLDGDANDNFTLQGAECLVFFLGGNGVLARDPITMGLSPRPQGFSTNPGFPFLEGGQRVGPFHEFDTSRLIDFDEDDVCPEYLDPIPGQIRPYLYFSSYGGSGYRPYGADGMPGTADDEIIRENGTPVMNFIYTTFDSGWASDGIPGSRPGDFHNAKSFQIISPGLDFEYGCGGTWVSGKGIAIKPNASDTYRGIDNRRKEFDNITNFSSGRLGETTTTVN